ncbi:MAG: hypothetical protein U9O85_06060 [Euryarchaeota archaeon]|nr:hypothetical protein [Euryarchaeota archaeon]
MAYHKAANAIENLDEGVRAICKRGGLREIPGVGAGIATVIEEFLIHGRSKRLERELKIW